MGDNFRLIRASRDLKVEVIGQRFADQLSFLLCKHLGLVNDGALPEIKQGIFLNPFRSGVVK